MIRLEVESYFMYHIQFIIEPSRKPFFVSDSQQKSKFTSMMETMKSQLCAVRRDEYKIN